jgi:hypothetical protein
MTFDDLTNHLEGVVPDRDRGVLHKDKVIAKVVLTMRVLRKDHFFALVEV